MAELFHDLRWIHIVAGTIAVIVFWIPAAASKGGRLHIRAGWVYAACMAMVVFTAFSMSGLIFALPLRVRSFAHPLSADEAVQFIRELAPTSFLPRPIWVQ